VSESYVQLEAEVFRSIQRRTDVSESYVQLDQKGQTESYGQMILKSDGEI
jgi:hypothetical protein